MRDPTKNRSYRRLRLELHAQTWRPARCLFDASWSRLRAWARKLALAAELQGATLGER